MSLDDSEREFEGFVEPETFGWRCVFEEEGAGTEVLGHDGQDDFVDEVSVDQLLSDGGPAIAPNVLSSRQVFPPKRPFKEVDGDVGRLGLVCGNDMKFPLRMRIWITQTRDHLIRRPPSEGLIHARHKLGVTEIAPRFISHIEKGQIVARSCDETIGTAGDVQNNFPHKQLIFKV